MCLCSAAGVSGPPKGFHNWRCRLHSRLKYNVSPFRHRDRKRDSQNDRCRQSIPQSGKSIGPWLSADSRSEDIGFEVATILLPMNQLNDLHSWAKLLPKKDEKFTRVMEHLRAIGFMAMAAEYTFLCDRIISYQLHNLERPNGFSTGLSCRDSDCGGG